MGEGGGGGGSAARARNCPSRSGAKRWRGAGRGENCPRKLFLLPPPAFAFFFCEWAAAPFLRGEVPVSLTSARERRSFANLLCSTTHRLSPARLRRFPPLTGKRFEKKRGKKPKKTPTTKKIGGESPPPRRPRCDRGRRAAPLNISSLSAPLQLEGVDLGRPTKASSEVRGRSAACATAWSSERGSAERRGGPGVTSPLSPPLPGGPRPLAPRGARQPLNSGHAGKGAVAVVLLGF